MENAGVHSPAQSPCCWGHCAQRDVRGEHGGCSLGTELTWAGCPLALGPISRLALLLSQQAGKAECMCRGVNSHSGSGPAVPRREASMRAAGIFCHLPGAPPGCRLRVALLGPHQPHTPLPGSTCHRIGGPGGGCQAPGEASGLCLAWWVWRALQNGKPRPVPGAWQVQSLISVPRAL